jgi:RNA polymerase sigma-70 factor (ECF subfamily)
VADADERVRFARTVLPSLDAAYNLARWLARDGNDAADIVQEAALRALRYFPSFRGQNDRAWFLRIVRNTATSWLAARRRDNVVPLVRQEPESGADPAPLEIAADTDDPETALARSEERARLVEHLAAMPAELRECLVLREIEDMSYKEIAYVAQIPIGTVMSRLSRARRLLADRLRPHHGEAGGHGL